MRALSGTDAADRDRWHRLHAGAKHRTPFSTLAYADAVRASFDRPFRMIVAGDADEPAAGMLVFERSCGPYRLAMPPPYTAYTPLVHRGAIRETDVNHRRSVVEAIAEYLEKHYHRLSVLLPPSVTDVRPYSWRGWNVSPLYSYRIRLRNPSEDLQTWSKTRRYDFRNHRGRFQVVQGDAHVEAIVRLVAESYERSHRALPKGRQRVLSLVRRLLTNSSTQAFAALDIENDRTCAAGIIALVQEKTAYYWLAGSKPGPSMTVLLGEACRLLHRKGIETLDLVGANTPSIAEFKRRFGSKLVPYYHAQLVGRPELRWFDYLRSLT